MRVGGALVATAHLQQGHLGELVLEQGDLVVDAVAALVPALHQLQHGPLLQFPPPYPDWDPLRGRRG